MIAFIQTAQCETQNGDILFSHQMPGLAFGRGGFGFAQRDRFFVRQKILQIIGLVMAATVPVTVRTKTTAHTTSPVSAVNKAQTQICCNVFMEKANPPGGAADRPRSAAPSRPPRVAVSCNPLLLLE